MATSIKPGSSVNVKVVKTPKSRAAVKTIVRLLSKDTGVKKENERHRKVKKLFRQNRRGGRFWDVYAIKQHPVAGKEGESGVIKATLDVLTDLKSVEKFVEVTPA